MKSKVQLSLWNILQQYTDKLAFIPEYQNQFNDLLNIDYLEKKFNKDKSIYLFLKPFISTPELEYDLLSSATIYADVETFQYVVNHFQNHYDNFLAYYYNFQENLQHYNLSLFSHSQEYFCNLLLEAIETENLQKISLFQEKPFNLYIKEEDLAFLFILKKEYNSLASEITKTAAFQQYCWEKGQSILNSVLISHDIFKINAFINANNFDQRKKQFQKKDLSHYFNTYFTNIHNNKNVEKIVNNNFWNNKSIKNFFDLCHKLTHEKIINPNTCDGFNTIRNILLNSTQQEKKDYALYLDLQYFASPEDLTKKNKEKIKL